MFLTLVPAFPLFMIRYSTEAGEWHTVTLKDGSIARLGPRTELIVRFDDSRRLIQQNRGEATFDVAKDPTRPLVVVSGTAMIVAIGTKFGVSQEFNQTRVTVAEGTVLVYRQPEPFMHGMPAESIRVTAGQQVLIDLWTPLVPKDVDARRELLWERGIVIFDGTPLDQAIGEFNRRLAHPIPLPTDPGASTRLIYGEFDLANRDAFVRHLQPSPQNPPRK